MINKKGQFVEIDFFLAILILALGIIVITAPFLNVREDIQTDRLSYDAVTMLATIKVKDLNNTFQTQIKENASDLFVEINNEDTITQVITKLLVESQKEDNEYDDYLFLIKEIVEKILTPVMPEAYKYEVTIMSGTDRFEVITIEDDEKTDIASQSRTILTGIEVGKPITGFISNAIIQEIAIDQTSYAFIGGFIGQGNLEFLIEVPEHEEIKNVSIEGLFRDDFKVHVNNNECSDIILEGFTNTNLPNCKSFITEGENVVEIKFLNNNITKEYVSGGTIKITYELNHSITQSFPDIITEKKYIPGIDGVINIYDSFYVPGKLQEINFYLEHNITIIQNISNMTAGFNKAKIRMTIANETLYENNNSGLQSVSNSTILTGNYENVTIPYRIGFPEFTSTIQKGKPTDVVIINDLSGTMGDSINLGTGFNIDCEPYIPPNAVSTSRLNLAKCLNKVLVDELFAEGESDVKIGFIGFSTYVLTSNYKTLKNHSFIDEIYDYIDGFSASGTTCVSCAVAAATHILKESPEGRNRLMILMSDGQANRRYIANPPDFPGTPPPFTSSGGPPPHPQYPNYSLNSSHAILWANYSKDNENIEIFSIAFALGNSPASQEARRMLNESSSGEGYYFAGNDGESLSNIYVNISQKVIGSLGYVAQSANLSFEDFDVFESMISPNSYIEYTYVPNYDLEFLGKIKITQEKILNNNSCNQEVMWEYDSKAYPGGGFLTSYSDNIWTSKIEANNNTLFNIFIYGSMIGALGDPFMIGIPPSILNNATNTLNISLHDGNSTISVCNEHNILIYDVYFPATFSDAVVREKSEGCIWNINSVYELKIPDAYTGLNECIFNSSPPSYDYDQNDSFQVIGYKIIQALMHEDELVIDLEKSNIDIFISQVAEVPYMWGPAMIGVTVWR